MASTLDSRIRWECFSKVTLVREGTGGWLDCLYNIAVDMYDGTSYDQDQPLRDAEAHLSTSRLRTSISHQMTPDHPGKA